MFTFFKTYDEDDETSIKMYQLFHARNDRKPKYYITINEK